MSRIVDSKFIKELNNVITDSFPNLIGSDISLVNKYLSRLIDFLGYTLLNHKQVSTTVFLERLRLNNYKDCKGLLYSLLPYFNKESDYKSITSLNDLYVHKKKDVNINNDTPLYSFTNIQYSRHSYDGNNCSEITFEEEYLRQNFYLLLDSIKLCHNKLYVNWIETIPYSIDTYQNEELYKNTIIKLENNEYEEFNIVNNFKTDTINDKTTKDYFSSLTMDDIYDTVTNEFYYNIKKYKWLIFDIVSEENVSYPILYFICRLFNLNSVFNRESIDNFNIIQNSWDKLLKNITNNIMVSIDGYLFTSDSLKKVVMSWMLFFDKTYSNKHAIKKNLGDKYKEFPQKLEEDDDELFIDVKWDIVINNINNVSFDYIYDFLYESFQALNNTFYSNFLVDTEYNTSINYNVINNFSNFDRNKLITIKYIYNFAKSLCHITINNSFIPLPRYWRSLDNSQRQIILNRLQSTKSGLKITDWFNIRRVLQNRKNITDSNWENINNIIFLQIKDFIVDMIFICLIRKGVLSKFIPNLELMDDKYTDYDKKSQSYLDRIESLKNSDDYNNSYYYLNGLPYKNFFVEINKEKETEFINYLDYLKSEKSRGWYLAYTLNYISQINFFHKFNNNRVIFLTGGTGVGKSTIGPVLTLYALKSINYNNSGKIVCTQPRQTPTINNAKTVSMQLGVPINAALSKNYYVQYKHQTSKHVDKAIGHLSLKFETDGTLINELNNPLLIKSIPINNDINFITENIYDIVIVDEAHEHNTNMDFILTNIKNTIDYNNSIKLIIVSATMDYDEPIYRRFYREINDNRMYPLNYYIKENNLDRINVDRRIDISEPGKTTKYKIIEHYDDSIRDATKDKFKDADKIIEIISSNEGNVLFFQPGEAEIKEQIEYLNKKLPAEIIALPFYSSLNKKNRELIEDIDDKLKMIKIDKEDILDKDEGLDFTEGSSTYFKFIIVATNIAEASITINSLKFVFDTGTQKINYFDYATNQSQLKLAYISETSRVQRKGRVGRTSDGEVYYSYPKGKMANNPIQYNISIGDIKTNLFNHIQDSDKIFFSYVNNPNIELNKNTFNNINDLAGIFNNNIHESIKLHYYNLNNFYDYFGVQNQFNNSFDKEKYHDFYKFGYSQKSLNDEYGTYYIIHPEELKIIRNINGKVIKSIADDISITNNKIVSNKMRTLWEYLLLEDYIKIDDNRNIVKSEYGTLFNDLLIKLDNFTNNNLFKSYLLSFNLNCNEYIIRLISLLESNINTLGKIITKSILIKNDKKINVYNFEEINNILGKDYNSDIIALLELINNIHKKLLGKKILLNIDTDNIYADEILQKYYKTHLDKENNLLESNGDLFNYNKLRQNNKIVTDIMNLFKDEDKIYYSQIKELSTELFIENSFIYDYIEKYLEIQNTIYLFKNDKMETNENELKNYTYDDLMKLKELIFNKLIIKNFKSIKHAIITCFLFAYPYNILHKINNVPLFLYLNDPSIKNLFIIKKLGIFNDTFVNPQFFTGYLHSVNINVDKHQINIISKIDPKLLINVSRFYFKDNILKKINEYKHMDYEGKEVSNSQLHQVLNNYYNFISSDINDFISIIKNINIHKIL